QLLRLLNKPPGLGKASGDEPGRGSRWENPYPVMGRSSDAGGSAAVLVLPVDFLAALHSPVLVHDQGRVEERPGRRLPGLLVDDEVRPADGLRGPGWILVRRRHLPEQVADIELFDADRERIRAHF